jgi:phospholipase/lecithinase/hemolysin
VAAALLAQSFGLNLEPSLWANGFMDVHHIFPPGFVPGTNYAFGGATASEDGTIVLGANLPDQVAAYTAHASNVADPSALYVVMIGGNDVILTALAGLSQPVADAALTGSVTSEVDQIKTLADDGAKDFLIVNVPNVGLIPLMTQDFPADAAAATTDSQFYDTNSTRSSRASACRQARRFKSSTSTISIRRLSQRGRPRVHRRCRVVDHDRAITIDPAVMVTTTTAVTSPV